MFDGINIVAIVGTTFFMMASATVWFSPLMFGKQWLHELNVTEAEIDASRKNMATHLGLTFIAYAAALAVLAHLVMQAAFLELSIDKVTVAALVLVIAILGNTALWENRSRVYFLINAGFYAYFVIVGMLMLKHWPW